jgi:hypothetical protein
MTRSACLGWTLAIAVSAFGCTRTDKADNRYPNGEATKTGEPAAAGADANANTAAGNATAARPNPAGTSGDAAARERARSDNRAPVTLVGCLQKGDGRSDYILTEVNSTRTTVGTSGATERPSAGGQSDKASGPDVVGQEQMRAAAHAYRLDGDRKTLEPLVGKQVRVSGSLEKSSDLNAHDDNGRMKDRDRTKIDEGDLAKVDVASVDSVSESCGAKSSAHRPSRSR